ncbi:hypothetical protein F183_A39610 [Bryobacterales bacterium F-183]|nr:hypothetical protein F183_A39610 [Bryobacterales bacterium F-183]
MMYRPWLLLAIAATGIVAAAQERLIAFSDEARPRIVRVELLDGSLSIRGYEGKDVKVTSAALEKDRVQVTEANNTVSISGMNRGPMVVQVPNQTSLVVRCVNCREAVVESVSGDLDINLLNGAIRLMNVSGSILAHSLNKSISAVITRLDPDKPSSFTSMNGTIDCTFPADLKADVKLRTENGKIHTDFDLQLEGGLPVRTDRGISGRIGGGGPELQMRAFNGSIYLRKK